MFVIAGVSGKVGGVVARELLKQKQMVKVIVRDTAKATAWSQRGAEVAIGSLDDAAFLTTALKGASGFFTLLPPDFAAMDFFASQKKRADAIATAVKNSGVKHVVMLSSIGADLPDRTGPIKGLHYLENALRATGTQLTAVRAGAFQENLGMSIKAAVQMGTFFNMGGDQDVARPLVATLDIGMVAARELLNKGAKSQTIDLHGPSYSTRQQALMLGTLLGKHLNIVDVPESARLETLMKSGMPASLAAAYHEMHQAFADGIVTPKADRMEQATTSLEETLRHQVAMTGVESNPVGWFEIPAKNLDRAMAFYEKVLELKIAKNEMGPLKMGWFPSKMAGQGAAGSLVEAQSYVPSQQGSLVYLSVADIEATLKRVVAQGGKVLNPKMGIGDYGFVAHFEDCEGNRVALHSPV